MKEYEAENMHLAEMKTHDAARNEHRAVEKASTQTGCGGGCGCGGHGKKHGVRSENTPADIADDFSHGRPQLGLRGK
ncbi:hypothetical protein [Arcanobacterium hippocoleae]|uniref:Uncharacterized protein n=1 Tax=Arcanobacterium hippocoleae TaxID=149017 RepID=A0ABU1T0Z0_9ACTO|nr:hypothetical protein [Arcanobacterium hippocoleae]MDR6939039.1 hypothetical protein [Arcanobacterium hippocoleae]